MCCLLQIFARHSGSFSEGLAIPGRLGGGIPIEVALFRVRTGTSGVATMKLKYLVMLMLVPAVVGVAVPSALAQAPRHRRPLLKCNSQPLLLPTCLLIPTGRVWVSTRVSTKQESKKHRSHAAKSTSTSTSTGNAAVPTKEAEENNAVTR